MDALDTVVSKKNFDGRVRVHTPRARPMAGDEGFSPVRLSTSRFSLKRTASSPSTGFSQKRSFLGVLWSDTMSRRGGYYLDSKLPKADVSYIATRGRAKNHDSYTAF